jgi:replicative DNA helicase
LRNPPHDIDAEMAVLGGILLDPGSFETAAGLVSATDFYPEKHRIIFASVQRLLTAGNPVDLISLSSLLKSDGNLDKAGGAAYLAELIDFIPSSTSVGYYCGVIQKKALARRTIEAARQIAEAAYDNEDPDTIISRAYASLEELNRQARGEDAALLTLDDLADQYEKHVRSLDKTRFITGFPEIDGIIRGVAPGEVLFISAYSGLFKSAFLQNILLNACGRTKIHHLFFSLEMPATRVFERTVQIATEEYTYRIESGFHHHEGYKERTLQDLRELGADKLIVCEEPCLTIERIEHYTRLARRRYGQLGAIGIDYLGLMGADGAKGEYERISYVAENSKHLAKRLNLPVIVLTQVNRMAAGAEVQKWSAKGSGAIEASADYMLGIQKDQNKNLILKILKNRNGEENLDFQVDIDAKYLKFRSVEPYDSIAANNVDRGKTRIRKGYTRELPEYDPY